MVLRINDGYRAWAALKTVLSNRGLEINYLLSLLFKTIGKARPREGDWGPNTPAPHYQPIEVKRRKGK